MRPTLFIAIALLASACERPARPLSAAPPEVIRSAAQGASAAPRAPAQAPAKPAGPSPAATTAAPSTPPEALTDAAISGKIRTALVGDPGMAGADVSINIDNGVVVLSGTVSSHEQSGLASAHAQRQDGVMRVDNQLRPALS